MQVACEVNYTEVQNDNGRWLEGVEVTCSRCGQVKDSFGTGEASIKRCLVMMRRDCQKGESNFYVAEDA